jgi:ribosomal protein S27E
LHQLKAAGATDWRQSAEDFVRHGLLELDYSYWLRVGLVEAGKETPWLAIGGFNYKQVEQKMRLYEGRPYPECRIMRRLFDLADSLDGTSKNESRPKRYKPPKCPKCDGQTYVTSSRSDARYLECRYCGETLSEPKRLRRIYSKVTGKVSCKSRVPV